MRDSVSRARRCQNLETLINETLPQQAKNLEAKNLSISTQAGTEALLASLADLQITLNDSLRIADVASDSVPMRQLPRYAMIGRPWLELVRESDADIAQAALTAAVSDP